MKEAFILIAVQCGNCKQAGPINPPLILFDKEQICDAGREIHKNTGVVCAEPSLVLVYNPAIVSNNVGVRKPLIHLPSGVNGNGAKQTKPVEEAAPATDGD
jgi:hypothetical protein